MSCDIHPDCQSQGCSQDPHYCQRAKDLNNMPIKEADGLFCVVGAAVNASQNRTWYGHQADAAGHARDLISRKNPRSNTQNAKRLYVVKIVEVVEENTPPISTRPVSISDFADLNVPHATQTGFDEGR